MSAIVMGIVVMCGGLSYFPLLKVRVGNTSLDNSVLRRQVVFPTIVGNALNQAQDNYSIPDHNVDERMLLYIN